MLLYPPGHHIFPTPQNEAFYENAAYDNLDSLKREIRLLRLLSHRGNDLIECERLRKTTLEEVQGSYCALSYCAGDPKKTQEILVDGLKFNVFANLGHALAEACEFWKKAHPESDCLLWVDQICINQKDLSERAHQVGFMREIYSSADQVLICLSTQNESDRGIKWLQKLHHDVPHFKDDTPEISQGIDGYSLDMNIHLPLDRIFSKSLYSLRFNEYLWANTNDVRFVDGWLAKYDMMERPWWRRAWVYQEFISSTQSHFLYGYQSIPWTILSPILASYCGVSRWLLKKNTRPTLSEPEYYPEHHRLTLMRNREEQAKTAVDAVGYFVGKKNSWSGPADIKSLLAHSRNCHSSDMRDKIFAFLGLAYPGYGIVPDHSPSNSVVEVFTETAKKIILFDNSPDCLIDAPDSRGLLADILPS